MDNEDVVKGNNRRNDNSEKKPRLGLLKKLKENKEEANDSSISPIKNNRQMYDKANQNQNKDNKSIMQKLLESKRKKEQLKHQYESASSMGVASKDNNNEENEEEEETNVKQNENDNEDENNNSNEEDNVSSSYSKRRQRRQASSSSNNNNNISNNNIITNRLKKLFQAKVDQIENNKPQTHVKDNNDNDDNNDDDDNNNNDNTSNNNNNEDSPTKETEIKQQTQLSKAELIKMALSNKKSKQNEINNNTETKTTSLPQTPKKSTSNETNNNTNTNTTNNEAPSSSYGFVSQNASSKKSSDVKNILELIKQKKTQKEKLQRSFEMEQQQQSQPEEQKTPPKDESPPHSNNSSNIQPNEDDDEEEEEKLQRAKFKEMMLQKEAAAQKQKQIQVEEERKIREKVRKEQEEKLRIEAEKRRKALEEEERIKREKEEKELQLQLEAQKLELQKQEEERRKKEEEEKRKKQLEEEEKKQREETRKLLLEELRKEVTKEITESVKKEFEEKVKKQQEELEEKEKALIEREREAQEKLQLSQNQSQLDNTQTTDEDDKRKKHHYYKQPKNIYTNNNSQSAMSIPTYNNNQQQQQPIYGNNNNNNRDEQSFDSIPANTIKRPYYKKQNHLMIYNKKPGLRGRSAEKVNSNQPPLNTNPNSLNNTHFYGSPKHFMQQQQDYNNGIVNNYQHIEQQHYSTLNNNIYNTNKSPGRFGIDINAANTTKTSRYINNSPINRSNIDNSYLYGNNNTSNNLSTYNFINPFQYNDYSQIPPPSNYNNNNTSMYQQQAMPPTIYRQPESLSMNFEDLLLFEQKLMDILRDFMEEKPMTNECFEWWNYYFNCSLYKQLEKTFKSETARLIVQESINYQLLSIIICYDVSSKPYVFDQVKVMIKPILIYNHHNLILIYENILSKVSSESINNIWVKKLSNLIYTVKSSPHNEMNPDNVFLNSPEPYDKLTEVDKIEFITRSIISNIRILLKNYSDGETTDVLVSLFKTIKHKSYEDINDIFLSKILRVDNPNGSVLASVLIRENAYFSTVEAPYLKNPSVRPYTLVLDLDETIIHFKINEHNETEGVLQVRPGIQEFLTTLGQYYEIVIFTAATQDYADLLIEELEENTFYFDYKLYRQHTIIIGNNFVKDLTRLGRSLDKVIIVDNMPQNFRLQKENGIHIRPFWGDDVQDTALIELQPILLNIAKEGGDVRKGLRKYKDEIMNKVTMNQTDRN